MMRRAPTTSEASRLKLPIEAGAFEPLVSHGFVKTAGRLV